MTPLELSKLNLWTPFIFQQSPEFMKDKFWNEAFPTLPHLPKDHKYSGFFGGTAKYRKLSKAKEKSSKIKDIESQKNSSPERRKSISDILSLALKGRNAW